MTLEEYIEEKRKRVANMTLAQARDLIAETLSHSDMELEFDKAVWMLLDCADEKINDASIEALKQDSIIDKIRAEIESINLLAEYTRGDIKRMALTIIDKYKAESEDK